MFARLQRTFPVMPLASSEADFQPVYVGDVAEAFVSALRDPKTRHLVFQLGGPDIYTLADLVRLAGRYSGNPRPVIALPEGLGRLQATLFEMLPGTPMMTKDNLDSMKVDNVLDPAIQESTAAALGIKPTALEAVAPRYLSTVDRLDQFRARAGR
jgi:NADH dehydrogenase